MIASSHPKTKVIMIDLTTGKNISPDKASI